MGLGAVLFLPVSPSVTNCVPSITLKQPIYAKWTLFYRNCLDGSMSSRRGAWLVFFIVTMFYRNSFNTNGVDLDQKLCREKEL